MVRGAGEGRKKVKETCAVRRLESLVRDAEGYDLGKKMRSGQIHQPSKRKERIKQGHKNRVSGRQTEQWNKKRGAQLRETPGRKKKIDRVVKS